MQEQSNYIKYRGKCKEMVDQAIANDPTLTAVRGHYDDFQWGLQPHWWCIKQDGTIYDPTALQFPSAGNGEYIPFNGIVNCSNCNKEMKEEDADFESNYCFCSTICHMRFVGL